LPKSYNIFTISAVVDSGCYKLVGREGTCLRAFSLIEPVLMFLTMPPTLHVIMQLLILYELGPRTASRFYIALRPVELSSSSELRQTSLLL